MNCPHQWHVFASINTGDVTYFMGAKCAHCGYIQEGIIHMGPFEKLIIKKPRPVTFISYIGPAPSLYRHINVHGMINDKRSPDSSMLFVEL